MNEVIKISESNYKEIEQNLFYAIKLIGVPAAKLVIEDIGIIVDYLQRNLKNYKVGDIRLAFESGVKGELDTDMNHYHTFNSLYVVNVLQSYNRKTCSDRRNKPEKTEAPLALTYDQSKDYAIKAEEHFLAGKDCKKLNWTLIFEQLEKEEKIVMSNSQKKEFLFETKIDIANEIKEIKEKGKTALNLIYILESPMILECECRKRAVINYYKTLPDENRSTNS